MHGADYAAHLFLGHGFGQFVDDVAEPFLKFFRTVILLQINVFRDHNGDAVPVAQRMGDGLLVVGAPGEEQGAGAVYVFVRADGTWTQQARLKASNAGAGDRFGAALAFSSNSGGLIVPIIVVGAPGEDGSSAGVNGPSNEGATDSGAVYVFTRDEAGEWFEQAYLKASNVGTSDAFGSSVGVVDTHVLGLVAAVGAPLEDGGSRGLDGDSSGNGAPESGAVYLFNRKGSTWSQQHYLKAPNADAGDGFGSSVALGGNGLVVGAPNEDSSKDAPHPFYGEDPESNAVPDSGAAYLFEYSADKWWDRGIAKASNAGRHDRFGTSVAFVMGGMAVGAPGEDGSASGLDGVQDDGASDSGAVYLFELGTQFAFDPPREYSYVKSSSSSPGDSFGSCIAATMSAWPSGGYSLAISAPNEDGSSTDVNGSVDDAAQDSGAVFVLTTPSL